MDPLTHALTGAAAALLISKPEQRKRALFCGVIAGMLPDLDIFIRSHENPLLTIQYHRHFTHSLFFVPIGALIASGFVWLVARMKIAWGNLYWYCLIAYLTHPLLDSSTSYGTHLLWPFTNDRVAWNIVPIVDPVPTLILLGGVISAFIASTKRALIVSVFGFLLYLTMGGIQKHHIEYSLKELAIDRGHILEKYEVKPSILQILVWRTIYEYEGKFYIDAFQKWPLGESVHYGGGSVDRYFYEKESRLSITSLAYQDLKKFHFFSDGFLAQNQEDPQLIGDLRFALLPHQIKPLWGVRLNFSNSDQHLRFENHRAMQENTWAIFLKMIQGLPIDE